MSAVNIRQDDDGYMGLPGEDSGDGPFIMAGAEYVAASVDKSTFFVAPRALRVVGITGRVTVAGTDAGAVTATVRKVASGTAIASGTALHSGTFNLKGTADTNQTLTLSTTAGDLDVPSGTALAVDFTGVLTAATGAITVAMCLK
jgi:hypothetical protein